MLEISLNAVCKPFHASHASEMKTMISQLDKGKSLDGFTSEFYKISVRLLNLSS